MARTETVEVSIPYGTFEQLRDDLLQEYGKRRYMAMRSGNDETFAKNDAIAEYLLQCALGNDQSLDERWHDGADVEATEDGTLEIVRERDANGNFTEGDG